MATTSRMAPPVSPVLLAGFALRPVPPALLQPVLDLAMRLLHRRHPGVFERMAGLGDPTFLVDPVDLPLVFLLRPDPQSPSLTVRREDDVDPAETTATIRGSVATLIDLLEGRIDGDALFFSRQLAIEGDTEAVVALRNAVDGAEITLFDDVLAVLGPLAGPARRAGGLAGRLWNRMNRDLETLHAALIAQPMRRAEAQGAELRKLEEQIATLRREAGRGRRTAG